LQQLENFNNFLGNRLANLEGRSLVAIVSLSDSKGAVIYVGP